MENKTNPRCINIKKITNIHFTKCNIESHSIIKTSPYYQLIFVVKGNLICSMETKNQSLTKNQMLILSPNTKYSLQYDIKLAPTIIYICFICDDKIIENFSSPVTLSENNIGKLKLIVKESHNLFFYNITSKQVKTKSAPPFGSEQLVCILLEYFLIELLRSQPISSKLTEANEISNFTIDDICNYINEHLSEKITINELSFLFHTNHTTLCSTFKKIKHKTIVEYINDQKIELSKQYILKSNKTFTEISDLLSFNSIHYFTRLFKKITGYTPSEYRENAHLFAKHNCSKFDLFL